MPATKLPLYISNFALIIIVAFGILAWAHFLSNVSKGAAIMVLFLFIANEVISRLKFLQLDQMEN